MCLGITVNKKIIGNIIILLANECKPLHHTNLLKLLYLIDEKSTIDHGAPITWLEFKAWKLGPVSPDVYYSKNKGYNKFYEYVDFKKENNNSYLVSPKKDFDGSLFCDSDLEIIRFVISNYGNLNSGKLIDITHQEGNLWDKTIKRNSISFSKENNTSDFSLNFLDLIEDDPFKKTIYYSTLENIEFASTLE